MSESPVIRNDDEILFLTLGYNGQIVGVNEVWSDVLKYDAVECIGRHVCDFVVPEYRPSLVSLLRLLSENQPSTPLHVSLRQKTGLPVDAILAARVQRDASGEPEGFVCEIWTMKTLERSMEWVRNQEAKKHANDTILRTFTAVTELMAKSRGVAEFTRALGPLIETSAGISHVLVEAEGEITPPWKQRLKAEIRPRRGNAAHAGATIVAVSRVGAFSPDVPIGFGRYGLLALWFEDAGMPQAMRTVVIDLPQDAAFREAWSANAAAFVHAISCAVQSLSQQETQALLLQQFHTLSMTDPLTKVFNRNKLEDVMATEEKRSGRYNTRFSVIMADIDHFKSVNDTYGHPVGDTVLAQIAATMQATLRTTDVVGRWGGEEFLIVCTHTGLEEATAAAELLRRRIESQAIQTVGCVTVSFGVATFETGDTVADVVSRADRALYLAKTQGRNRVCRMWRNVSDGGAANAAATA